MPAHPLWLPFAQPDAVEQDEAWVAGGKRRLPGGKVEVVAPDPSWPAQFEGIAERVRAALGDRVIGLEHIGSTSVPGLWAKPVIDIDLIVRDSSDEATYLADLEAAAFDLVIREPDWFEHRCFSAGSPRCNLHVFSAGAAEPRRHRAFRDWLTGNSADRQKYGALKRELSTRSFASVMDYNNAKSELIYEIYERIFAADVDHVHTAQPIRPASMRVSVTDYHTAGEPFRIVTGGLPDIVGSTVLDRREHAQTSADVDAVRQLLVNEPRGHADMYGGFVVPADDAGADFGVLFWHKDGYSTACGHGAIALGAWAIESGRVPAAPDGDTEVVIDVPSGRVTVRVSCANGVVQRVAFRNVASYVVARDIEVVTSRGAVRADISYGGALYASIPAATLGLTVAPGDYAQLIAVGREIKWALNGTEWARHPSDARLDGIYGTILFDDLGGYEGGPHQRNVTVFADGEVDRSPCGSGTSARIALLADDGALGVGETLRHDSIVGTTFLGRVVERVHAEGRAAVITEVEGAAYETGAATFTLDPRDPLGTGFVLR